MLSRSRPLILAYNLWGKLAFNVSTKILIQSPAIRAGVTEGSVQLCPLVNFSKSDVETRAKMFGTKINAMMKGIDAEKVDIVAYSMAGLDVNLALQEDKKLADRVQNLVTVGTPRTGTLLATLYSNNQLDSAQLEKSNLCTGVHYSDLMECNDETMKQLNEYLEPYGSITYHSIAGDKAFQDQTGVFRSISKRLLESSINRNAIFNDGLFFDNEVISTQNSLTLNADHMDLSPIAIDRGQDHYGHIFRYLNSY